MTLISCRLLATVVLGAAVACSNGGIDPVVPPPAPPPPPPPSSGVVTVEATPVALAFASLGTAQQLAVTPRDATGGAVVAAVTYTTRRTGIVQVSASGLVTSLGNGADTVVAAAGGKTALIPVNVTQVVTTVQVGAPATPLDLAGVTATVVAQARDANNRVIAGASFTYASSNAGALPVDVTGVVTVARAGTARITATLGSQSGFVDLTAAFTGPLGPPITGALTVCTGGMAGPFPCENVDLVAYLPRSAIGTASQTLNDIWGWTDPLDGKEYAIVLRRDGTSFVDVSVASDPRFVGYLPITPGATPNVWHDVKVYQNRAYIVADGAGAHGMQVFDLTQLRGVTSPRVFAPNSVYRNINSAHNIAINAASGFGYIVGASGGGTTCGGGLHMVDLRNPTTPVFAGCFADTQTGRTGTGYTHDVQCVIYIGPDAQHAGREICFGANETAISIADVTVKTAPIALARAGYPGVAYTHQGWLTEDHRYFLVNDELDEGQGTANTRTLVWDVTDLDDPVLVTQYFGPTRATDHNHYILGTRMFMSNYQFGLRVVDVSSPTTPAQIGFFDTAPALSNTPGYGGSWSNYPFFASGIIVMSSSTEGFFVLRAR